MPLTAEQQALVSRFDAATNLIAAKIRDLIANPPSQAEFNAALGKIATDLEAMGSPGSPLPPTP